MLDFAKISMLAAGSAFLAYANRFGGQQMRHQHHIHPTDLMKPDALSEVVLVGGLVAIVGLLLALLRALLQFD